MLKKLKVGVPHLNDKKGQKVGEFLDIFGQIPGTAAHVPGAQRGSPKNTANISMSEKATSCYNTTGTYSWLQY
jgi:hypothetical protein